MSFHIEVVTPERMIYSGEAVSVIAPGAEGDFGVLAHHLPMVVSLGVGELSIREASGRTVWMALEGGFFEVSDNKAIVLADGAELASDIDVNRAHAALERARHALEELEITTVNRELARAALARAEARLKAAADAKG